MSINMASGSGDGNKPHSSVLRLPTFKPVRDLTLGASSTNRDVTRGGMLKRKFVPNIPAPKNKTNDQNASASTTDSTAKAAHNRTPNKSHGPNRGGRDRGRGRGRGNELIQLKSIFDEGPMEQLGMKAARAASLSYFGSGSKSSSFSSTPNKTKLSKSIKKEGKDGDDDDDDKDILADLLRDNFIDDDDDDNDNDGYGFEKPKKQNPVLLPFSGKPKKDFKVETKLLDIKKTKIEPQIDDKPTISASTTTTTPMEIETDMSHDPPQQQQQNAEPHLDIIFNKNNQSSSSIESDTSTNVHDVLDLSQLYLIQLPDVLPGFPQSSSSSSLPPPSSSSSSHRPSTSKGGGGDNKSGNVANDKAQTKSSLNDFSDGFIGKLRIRKSGKIELVLGDVVLEGFKGVPAEFLQEAVMIDKEHTPNRFVRLGSVSEKISFVPNIESLLKQAEADKDHKS